MNLAEQAAQRIELARNIGVEPQRWIVTIDAEAALISEAEPDAWTEQRTLLHGVPIVRGVPRSEWGLELALASRAV